MAKFVHTVEAEQFTGNVEKILVFLSNEEVYYDEITEILFVPELIDRPAVKWEVKLGDFIVKTKEGFTVYKAERFKKEFRAKKGTVKKALTKEEREAKEAEKK